VLPSQAQQDDFFTQGSANTLRNVLSSWPLSEVRNFFEQQLGLPLRREETGKLFPVSDDARDVVRVLMAELARVHGILRAGSKVVGIDRVEGLWRLTLAEGQVEWAERVILATGGLSMPTTGSDGTGLRLAQNLGHTLVPTAPALVPLTGHHPDLLGLSGVSCEASLTATAPCGARHRVTGSMLLTHKGYSGPAVLDISQFVVGGPANIPIATLHAGFGTPCAHLPDHPDSWQQRLGRSGSKTVWTVVREGLPRRLADALVASAGVTEGGGADGRASELPKDARKRLLRALTACPLPVSGSEGYRTAEVTTGGVSLDEVVGRTLESRRCPELYLTGEMLDVTGKLGGYNFLWAWVSGRKAGLAAAASYHRARGAATGSAASLNVRALG
jgi:predicted Rossmann fold flavoprotein